MFCAAYITRFKSMLHPKEVVYTFMYTFVFFFGFVFKKKTSKHFAKLTLF